MAKNQKPKRSRKEVAAHRARFGEIIRKIKNGDYNCVGLFAYADINAVSPYLRTFLREHDALTNMGGACTVPLYEFQDLLSKNGWDGPNAKPADPDIITFLYEKKHEAKDGQNSTTVSTSNGRVAERVIRQLLIASDIEIISSDGIYSNYLTHAVLGSPCKWDLVALTKSPKPTVIFIQAKLQCGSGSIEQKWQNDVYDVFKINGYCDVGEMIRNIGQNPKLNKKGETWSVNMKNIEPIF